MSTSLFRDVGWDENLAACLLQSRGHNELKRLLRYVVASTGAYLIM
jgi:hypothetical protein